MNIKELCYELYKLDWMRRIPAEVQIDTAKEWYRSFDAEERKETTLEDYIWDCGYGGSLYVCFNEFLGAEYQDDEYIRWLLDDDSLFAEYEQDKAEDDEEYEVTGFWEDGNMLKVLCKLGDDDYVGWMVNMPAAWRSGGVTKEMVEQFLKDPKYETEGYSTRGDLRTVMDELGLHLG